MEFSKKYFIGCIPAYTYCDYVHLNNSIDAPKYHHNNFILNQEPFFYITSLSKLVDDTFTLLPHLYVDK